MCSRVFFGLCVSHCNRHDRIRGCSHVEVMVMPMVVVALVDRGLRGDSGDVDCGDAGTIVVMPMVVVMRVDRGRMLYPRYTSCLFKEIQRIVRVTKCMQITRISF